MSDDQFEHARQLGYEPRDVSGWGVAAGGLLLLLLVGFSLALMSWFLGVFTGSAGPSAAVVRPAGEQGEATQSNQQRLRETQQQVQRRVLTSYGWIDRDAKVARIPMERAIEIIAVHGELQFPADAE